MCWTRSRMVKMCHPPPLHPSGIPKSLPIKKKQKKETLGSPKNMLATPWLDNGVRVVQVIVLDGACVSKIMAGEESFEDYKRMHFHRGQAGSREEKVRLRNQTFLIKYKCRNRRYLYRPLKKHHHTRCDLSGIKHPFIWIVPVWRN